MQLFKHLDVYLSAHIICCTLCLQEKNQQVHTVCEIPRIQNSNQSQTKDETSIFYNRNYFSLCSLNTLLLCGICHQYRILSFPYHKISKYWIYSHPRSGLQSISYVMSRGIFTFSSCTVNSSIEAGLVFNFWTFRAGLYLSFCQILQNKSPNFHDFFSLLFENV